MPKQYTLAKFDGGLNANTTEAVGNNDLVVATNVAYNAAGQLQTRRGYRTFGSQIGSNPITSYFYYRRDDTRDKVAVCVSGSQMYYLDTNGTRQTISGAGNLIQYETIPGQTSKRTRRDFAVYKNKVYMCDGVNPYCSFDGTTRSQIGISAVGTGLTFNATTDKRLYTSHGLSDGDEVYYTAATTAPTGLTQYQVYYVINSTANDFEVATAKGGTKVDFSTNGSGTMTLYKITEPRIRYILLNSGVAFSAGDDKNPYTLYYSNALTGLSDLTNINSNLAIIGPGEGGIINGLHDYAQGVLIFKNSKIYYASLATGSFTSSAIDSQSGGYGDRAITNVANSLVYYSDRGVDSIAKRSGVDGAGALESLPLSNKVKEILDLVEPSTYNSCAARYVKPSNNYIFTFDTNGDDIPDTTLVYSSLTGGRTKWTLPALYDYGEYVDSDNNTQYLFSSANGGQMYEFDYGFDDNGVAIEAEAQTKSYDLGEGMFERVDVEGRMEQGGEVDLSVLVDNSEVGAGTVTNSNLDLSRNISLGVREIATSTLGGGDAPSGLTLYKYRVRIPFYARGSSVALNISSSGTQRIFEKMTVFHEGEQYDLFDYSNIL